MFFALVVGDLLDEVFVVQQGETGGGGDCRSPVFRPSVTRSMLLSGGHELMGAHVMSRALLSRPRTPSAARPGEFSGSPWRIRRCCRPSLRICAMNCEMYRLATRAAASGSLVPDRDADEVAAADRDPASRSRACFRPGAGAGPGARFLSAGRRRIFCSSGVKESITCGAQLVAAKHLQQVGVDVEFGVHRGDPSPPPSSRWSRASRTASSPSAMYSGVSRDW